MKHEISLRYECTRAASILFLFTAIAGLLLGAEQEKLPLLYPFTRDGKWGYIDGTGAWVIQPRFGRCLDVFESDRVRVWEGDKVGYIDRKGQWIVEPGLYYGLSGRDEPFEVVRIDRKLGILARSGQLALPVNYDEIVLSGDRA